VSLELERVSVTLGDRVLVPPLSATVAPGEVLAVMGPSGSGKSSLLAHLCGLLQPPLRGAGSIRLDGRDLGPLPTEQRRLGLLFQDDLLYPHWTVRENLLFAVPPGPRAAREGAVAQALADAEVPTLADARPGTLSGGQRARVALLRALLAEPRALLLDEPFSKLDAALRQRMRDFTWQTLARRGVPALLVTHDRQDLPPGAALVELDGV
jgi:putative thiamine transport system ATP-binding protein